VVLYLNLNGLIADYKGSLLLQQQIQVKAKLSVVNASVRIIYKAKESRDANCKMLTC
jgi:hypothetical protein